MIQARPEEGPRAPLFYCALALACGGLAHAQSVDQSALQRCAGLATDDQKLACFESIVSAGRVEPDPAAAPAAEPAPEPVAAPAAELAPAAIVETAPEPAPEASPAAAAPAAASAEDFGREHLETVEEARSETLAATVVDVTETRHDELVFHLDNGQVWQQMEKRYYPYPRNQQFDITITQGMLGEYQLRVGGEGRKVTVKRVR